MTFYIEDFVWLEWVVEKIITKHNVDPGEVEECFFNPPYKLLQAGNGKYKLLGRSDSGRYLLVVFSWEANFVKVITARDMESGERRYYRGK
ncbi:MAG TPA: BrnT family toxin [Chloroflexia bacterium]